MCLLLSLMCIVTFQNAEAFEDIYVKKETSHQE